MLSPSNILATLLVLLLIVLSKNNVNGKILPQDGCNIFQGNWIEDDSYPLYDSTKCPFFEKQFDCSGNGRPDKDYMKYKWQPTGCGLPRFNGTDFLAKLKGKTLLFVGDSLSLNQWQSLTCLLHVAVPQANYISKRTGGLSTFTFPEYNVSINFERNAFLVDIVYDETDGRVLLLGAITTSIWRNADVLIYDSWHWWLHNGTKQPWDLIIHGNITVKDMDRLTAYEIALTTWSKWIDINIDPARTKVFFQGVSPDHNSGQGDEQSCVNQIKPLENPGRPHPAELVVEKILNEMEKPVYLLNITTLSQLRVDGHPSVYGHGGHRDMDCTHWCLAGVPDIWNEFLYNLL